MAPQQVESQVFPFQLEWIGGRSTFSQSPFSARNALICLEDMKESEVILPIILVKTQNQVIFRPGNKMMEKVFELDDIVQIHCFPTDPNHAIFEINLYDGSARFEVVRTPGNESLKNLQDFVFTRNFAYTSASVLPKQNNESSAPVSDGYEAPEPTQPAIDEGVSMNFQTAEGYEDVAMQNVDEPINKLPSPASRSEDTLSAMEVKAKNSVEEVDRARQIPPAIPISSDTRKNRSTEEIPVELIHEAEEGDVDEDKSENEGLIQEQPQQKQRHAKAEASKHQKFAKMVTLKEFIAEERIDTRNYHDDGKFYVVSKKGPKPSNRKSFNSQSNGYSEKKSPKRSTSRGQAMFPQRGTVRNQNPQPDSRCELRNTSPSLHILMETPITELNDFERVVGAGEGKHGRKHNDGLYYFNRNPSALQHNPFEVHPYNESYYSFVYLKNNRNDSSFSDSLSF
ncbi:unnamed protein product [Hymenolepis diminuta]|uniref:NPL domain-containing protein n=1 Tax=Hymenolepis diminuta TaxID=6216 RepID=A0A158QCG4_HYMDI|nr:unnamed protein product [Hymenolepis diminuta]VUZ53105.1 unnamed protein product [Hymenolepis diminuta]